MIQKIISKFFSKTKIYTVTTFEKNYFEELVNSRNSKRTVGFYFDKKHAFELVENNYNDIYETSCRYAVIEEFGQGAYYISEERWWFEWDKSLERYVPISCPPCCKSICNFGIG